MIGRGLPPNLRAMYERAEVEDRQREAKRIALRLAHAIGRETPAGAGRDPAVWAAVARADDVCHDALRRFMAGELRRDQLVAACSALLGAWKAAGAHYSRRNRGE